MDREKLGLEDGEALNSGGVGCHKSRGHEVSRRWYASEQDIRRTLCDASSLVASSLNYKMHLRFRERLLPQRLGGTEYSQKSMSIVYDFLMTLVTSWTDLLANSVLVHAEAAKEISQRAQRVKLHADSLSTTECFSTLHNILVKLRVLATSWQLR